MVATGRQHRPATPAVYSNQMPSRPTLAVLLLLPLSTHAAVVRGHVTTALGAPAPGARVQLIRLTGGARSVAAVIVGPDGSFELRSEFAGRFVLLTSPSILATTQAPQIGNTFYAGRTDLVLRDVALNATSITPETTSAATLRETPLAQLSQPATQLNTNQLLTQAGLLPALAPNPGVFIVQQGQTGTPAALYLRGASPEATKVTLDGLSIEDLGGGFNLATLSSSGLASSNAAPTAEILAGPNPLGQLDATAGQLALHTPESTSVRPALTYTGDAGPLGSYCNEVTVSAAPSRFDLFATASRFDTSNDDALAAVPLASPYHLATAAANLGYHISSATSLRATARRDLSATAFAPPFDLYHLPPTGKLTSANTYAVFAFETRTAGNWHNQLTYGLARKQAVLKLFATPATGRLITITGANGYAASGLAALPVLPTRDDQATSRDEFTVQSDRPFKPWLTPLFTFRYQREHAAETIPAQRTTLERSHLSGALGLSGEFHHRIIYQASGFLDSSPTLGFTGAPRLGLTYAPVRAGTRKFRGTTLHLTLATGLREPTLAEATRTPPHTRTLEAAIDQAILPRKLTLRAAYFHNQFSHDFEPNSFTSVSQTLAYRTQGLEASARYQPGNSLALTAGYTYLAAVVEQSALIPVFNPAYPLNPIGALAALPGARPFHRPPNTGFAAATYSGRKLTASLSAAIAGRSDDSTNLPQSPSLLLPNRNLSPGYTALDAFATFNISRHIVAFTQLTNLFDNRHIAPIGYTSTPFLIRTGLRIRIGGE